MKPYLSVIVPAYNEAQSIRRTLDDVRSYADARSYSHEIIVAADGTDGTREQAAEFGGGDPRVVVVGTPKRRGKGRGIRDGVALARGEVIGFVDADGKTPIEDLDKLLPWLHQGFDLVIGSRGLDDSRIEIPQPLYRRLGARGFGLVMHLTVGLWSIRDTQCGFKFFRGDVARDLFARQVIDGYMFDVEVLHLAELSGYRIKEIGVRWRDDRDSRLQLIAGNWRNMIDLMRIRARRSQPRPHPLVAPSQSGSGDETTV